MRRPAKHIHRGTLIAALVAAMAVTGCADTGSTGGQPTPTGTAIPAPPRRPPTDRPPTDRRPTDRSPSRPVATHLVGSTSVPSEHLRQLPVVSAMINGHSYRLAIDTGSADLLRLAPAVSTALGLRTVGEAHVGDPSGASTTVPLVTVDHVTIGRATFDGITATVGGTVGDLTPDGIIGLGLFADLTVTIDNPGGQLRLTRSPLRADSHTVPFTEDHGVPAITVTAGGTRISADLDTGGPAAFTVPSPDAVPLTGQPEQSGTGQTANGTYPVLTAGLRGDLSVAGWTTPNPRISIVSAFPSASLGAGYLGDYAVTFDMPGKLVRFTR